MSLFIESPVVSVERRDFKKEAAVPVALSRDDTKWLQEITGEVLKAHPYLQHADVQVQITRVDNQTGSGTGRVVLSQQRERMDMPPVDNQPLFLPFVIRGYELSPLDIATNGESYFPATQQRIEQFLFPASIASVGPPQENISSMGNYINDMLPPSRGYQGLSGLNSQVKLGSALPNVLDDALLEADPRAVDFMRSEIRGDLAVADALRSTVPYSMMKISAWKPAEIDPTPLLPFPSTVFMEKAANGKIRITMANRQAYVKIAQEVPQEEAMEQIPQEGQEQMQQQMDQQGYAAMQMESPVMVPALPTQDPTTPIRATGTYSAYLKDGSLITGWATRNLNNFDGSPMEHTVFTNGVVFDVKPEIAGVMVGTGQLPPTSRQVSGAGLFAFRHSGDIHCYGPAQILSTGLTPTGDILYMVMDPTGQQVILQPVDELVAPSPMGEGLYGIPRRFEFIPLTQQAELLPPGQIMKMAAARIEALPGVDVSYVDGYYTIDGDSVEALPVNDRTGITKSAAAFLLAVCGVPVPAIERQLKKCASMQGATVRIPNTRKIIPYEQVKKASQKELPRRPRWILKEASYIADMWRNGAFNNFPSTVAALFKTAAPMPDSETIDSLLSLNVINPRTVSNFIRQRPALEQALSVLCSLLMFVRLGAPGVPELALERCIENMDDVLSSLDLMSYRV